MANRKHKKNKKKEKVQNYKGFFAYPGDPLDRRKIIHKSISDINSKSKQTHFNITSWTNIEDKSSTRIIANIMESIHKSDVLIGDITDLNPNVLFEIGYAFGSGKKLLLITQGFSSDKRKNDIDDLGLLTGINIDSYQNDRQLTEIILSNVPDIFEKREPEILKYDSNPYSIISTDKRGLFLKGYTNHQNAITALTSFKSIFFNCVVDDWGEDSSQSLLFYIREIKKASGITALFVDSSWDNSRVVNARFSFICGIALGLQKNILMIGLPGFKTPFDYKEIMISKNDDETIISAIREKFEVEIEEPTINQISPILTHRSKITNLVSENQCQLSSDNPISKDDKEIILIDVNIGNSIAENEELELSEYYIETGQYHRALKSKQAIVIGSKGSGKTACFYKIRDYLNKNHPNNLVCEIKPSDYKMERFLESLRLLGEGKGLIGHVLENVWKMIVYSSILETIYKEVKQRPSYVIITNDEVLLEEFVLEHFELINSPFEQKLEKTCTWLEEVSHIADNFSKKIHDEFLSKARQILIPILNKRQRVVILIDNLDKAWESNRNLPLQSQLIFNLLGIHRRLHTDFGIEDVSVLIFIRRNIFEYILLNVAREPDKLSAETIELLWNDKEVLLKVIEQRFSIASGYWGRNLDNVWDTFFKFNNEEISLTDWIYQSVLPRPRDLIRFIQDAIEIAISREHSEIYEEDLEKALDSYSGFALNQIIAEYKAEEPWIIDFLNSFMGERNIFTYKLLVSKLKKNCTEVLDLEQITIRITTLVSINFLGVRLNGTPVTYAYDIQECNRLRSIIRNYTLNNKTQFVIHPVFYRHLKIKDIGQKPYLNMFNLDGLRKIFG